MSPLRRKAALVSGAGSHLWWLFAASLAVHFWYFGSPAAVVFDEYHFGKYANAYCCTHEYFFDVHPPHGKLLPALVLELNGYDGSQAFAHIGEPLEHVNPSLLRVVPAAAGTLIPIAVAVFLLQLGATPWAALLGGWMALFENALVLQSRILSLDSQLILATLLGLILALEARKRHTTASRWGFAAAAGAAAGFALGTKATGLASVFLVCVSLSGIWEATGRRSVQLPLIAVATSLLIYFAGWVLHFLLLTEPGPGDIWGPPTGDILNDVLAIQATTLGAHSGLQESHPYGSSWWIWPLMWRPIFYFGAENSALYLVGNPLVWWSSSALALFLAVDVGRRILNKGFASLPTDHSSLARYQLLLAFMAFFLPHMLISRVMFLYHYLPALVFAICLAALQLDRVGFGGRGTFWQLPVKTRALFVLVFAGFFLVAPFTYGWPLPSAILNWMHAFSGS